MEWVEISAKTTEEAKELALDRLGVDERDAEFEVVEEPRTGIFGRPKGEARVRARVKPTEPRAKNERRERRSRSDKSSTPRTNKKSASSSTDTVETDSDTGAVARDEKPAPRERPRTTERSSTNLDDLEDLTLEQQAELVASVVRGVVEAIGTPGSVEINTVDDETAEVAVTGDNLGFLIGPRGRTLHALNEVSRSVVLRRGNTAPSARVHVDVSGYRARRRAAVITFTGETAAKVVDTGMDHVFEPMNAADRKIIHDAASEIDGVRSISEGEDHGRRVVLVPA